MFRLIIVITLVVGGIFAGMIGLGLLAGAATPTGEQIVFTQPRRDQWTKVALLELKRNVAVNRYLPIRVGLTQWSSDGKRLIVSGGRNDRSRIYTLGYSPEDRQNRWLSTLPQDGSSSPHISYSPDMRWYVVPTRVEDELDVRVLPIDYGETFESADPFVPPPDATSFWTMGSTLWTPDSRTLIYSKTRIETRSQNFGSQFKVFYYVVDIETGEKRPFLDESIYELQLSPDGQYIFYSTLKKAPLPSPSSSDYQTSFSYYVYNLETRQQQHVADSPIQQRLFSPDGKYLLYQRVIAPEQVMRTDTVVDRFLLSSTPWYQSMTMYSYYSPINPHPVHTYLMTLETGEQRQLIANEFGSAYEVYWMSDSQTLLFNVQRTGFQAIVSQVLRMPNPMMQTYIARLDSPAPQLLKHGDRWLGVMQTAQNGSQLVMSATFGSSTASSGVQSTAIYVYDADSGEISEIDLQGDAYMFANWSPDGRELVITTLNSQAQFTQMSPYATLIPGAGVLPTIAPLVLPTPPLATQPVLSITVGLQQLPPASYRLYIRVKESGEMRLLATTYEPTTLIWSANGSSAMYFDNVPGIGRILHFIEDVTAPVLSIRPIDTISLGLNAYRSQPVWRPG